MTVLTVAALWLLAACLFAAVLGRGIAQLRGPNSELPLVVPLPPLPRQREQADEPVRVG